LGIIEILFGHGVKERIQIWKLRRGTRVNAPLEVLWFNGIWILGFGVGKEIERGLEG
jgi:hypothetical protein